MKRYSTDEVTQILEIYRRAKKVDLCLTLRTVSTYDAIDNITSFLEEINEVQEDMERFPQIFKSHIDSYKDIMSQMNDLSNKYLEKVKGLMWNREEQISKKTKSLEEKSKTPSIEKDEDLPF